MAAREIEDPLGFQFLMGAVIVLVCYANNYSVLHQIP